MKLFLSSSFLREQTKPFSRSLQSRCIMKLFLSSSFPKSRSASPSCLISSSSSFSSSAYVAPEFFPHFAHYTEARLDNVGPDYWIVHSHINTGHYAYALNTALRRHFFFPSDFPAIRTANLLLSCLVEKQNPSVAVSLWKQWKGLGFTGNDDTYSIMIKAYCDVHDFSGADRILFKDMEEAGFGLYKMFAISDYLRGLCSNGGAYFAFKILIGRRILQQDGLSPHGSDFVTVLRGFCWELKMEAAERVMVIMEAMDLWVGLSCYSALIYSYSKLGRLERAAVLFGEARQKDLALKASHYTTLISGYRRIEDMDNMVAVFDDMKKNGISPDFVVHSIVIQGLCWAGRLSKAEEIVREMASSDAGTIDMIINRLIEGLYKCGEEKGAETLVDQRKAREIKAGVYVLKTGKED